MEAINYCASLGAGLRYQINDQNWIVGGHEVTITEGRRNGALRMKDGLHNLFYGTTLEFRNRQWRRKGPNAKDELARCALLSSQTTTRTITLPLEYYQLLGVETHQLGDAVARKYEERVAQGPPAIGFSEEALAARAEILQAACRTLTNTEERQEYNASLYGAGGEVFANYDLPMDRVVGALLLLAESGQLETALAFGESLLDDRSSLAPHQQRDIALAQALGMMHLIDKFLSQDKSAVVAAYDLAEEALQLLQAEGGKTLAVDLQLELESQLVELRPHVVLHLLSLPLDEQNLEERREGLFGVRKVLWGVPLQEQLSAEFTRERFMNEAFALMTTTELLEMFQETPPEVPARGDEVYVVALAQVAEGISSRKPWLIKEADGLFKQLQQSLSSSKSRTISALNADSMPDPREKWTLERGMVALLLGQVEDCKYWLGMDTDPPSGNPAIVAKVKERSRSQAEALRRQGGEPLLPGLCSLLEEWLGGAVYPRFRNTALLPAPSNMDINDYFEDESVQAYLQDSEREGGADLGSSLLAPLAAIGSSATGLIQGLRLLASQAVSRIQPAKKPGPSDSRKSRGANASVPSLGSLPAQQGPNHLASYPQDSSTPPGPAGEAWEGPGPRSQGYGAALPRSSNGNGNGAMANGAAVAAVAGPAVAGLASEAGKLSGVALGADTWRRATGLGNSARQGTGANGAKSPASFSWASAGVPSSALAVAAGVAVMGGLVVATLGVPRVKSGLVGSPLGLAGASVVGLGRGAAVRVKAGVKEISVQLLLRRKTMDKEIAEVLVRRWNHTKALAMGPKHETSSLKKVLGGSMLEAWTGRATEWVKGGYFTVYDLLSLEINNLISDEDGSRVVAEVTLQESAAMFNDGDDVENDKPTDSYRSTYALEYEFTYGPHGWRITGGSFR